ncbi:MAG: histidine kinase, partial [Deltaproteobacteria bacterium]
MRLGAKVVLTTAAIFFGLITVLFLVSQIVLLGSFRKLEQADAGRNVERVFSALKEEMKALGSTTRDWAAWDDTYLF